jgi:hypothetical protein
MGTGGIFLGIKWPEREANHSPPTNAEVKKTWVYTSTLPYMFMAWCVVKYGDSFRFINIIIIIIIIVIIVANEDNNNVMKQANSGTSISNTFLLQ